MDCEQISRYKNLGGGEVFCTRPACPLSMDTGSFPGVKRPGCGADHPPHLEPMLKKEYSYITTPRLGLHDLFEGEHCFQDIAITLKKPLRSHAANTLSTSTGHCLAEVIYE